MYEKKTSYYLSIKYYHSRLNRNTSKEIYILLKSIQLKIILYWFGLILKFVLNLFLLINLFAVKF